MQSRMMQSYKKLLVLSSHLTLTMTDSKLFRFSGKYERRIVGQAGMPSKR